MAWQTNRLACLEGEATACLAVGHHEEACALGDLEGCAAHWGEVGPAAWEASALAERCPAEPGACELLERYGWTLPFRRLAESGEPVFVGPMAFVEGGGMFVLPSGDVQAQLYDPASGARLGEVHFMQVGGFDRQRQQERYEVEGAGHRAELERNVLRVWRGEEEVAVVRGQLPLSPMAIDRGRLVVGGRLVFDLAPEPTDPEATAAWFATVPPAPVRSTEPGHLVVEVAGAEEPVPVHLYDTLRSLEPLGVVWTDEGFARFEDLPPGEYTVQAASPAGGDHAFASVPPGGEGERFLELDPERVVHGRVRTRWGRAVPGALVHVEHLPVLPVQTDTRGRFAVPIRPTEEPQLWAEHAEGLSRQVPASEAADLRLVPLDHPDVLEIRTLGEGGEPVEGRIDVSAGDRARVAGPGGTTRIVRDPGESLEVRVRWGAKRAQAPIPPEEELLIVYFTNAQVKVAAPAMTLLLETPDGELRRLAQGRSLREAELSLLPAGDYVLWHHSSRGLERYAFSLGASEVLELEPPFEAAGLTVTGQLVDGSGEPLIGVRLQGHRMGGDFGPYTARTDLEGRFELRGLHPGAHSLELAQRTESGWRHFDDLDFDTREGTELGSVVR